MNGNKQRERECMYFNIWKMWLPSLLTSCTERQQRFQKILYEQSVIVNVKLPNWLKLGTGTQQVRAENLMSTVYLVNPDCIHQSFNALRSHYIPNYIPSRGKLLRIFHSRKQISVRRQKRTSNLLKSFWFSFVCLYERNQTTVVSNQPHISGSVVSGCRSGSFRVNEFHL